MEKKKTISGFSKLSKRGKIKWIVENFFRDPEQVMRELVSFWVGSEEQQKIIDGFSENTISNYLLPYGVAPNFVINNKTYCVPMVIEESSVVAAASSAAKYWMTRGGFKTEIVRTTKVGQVYFYWFGKPEILQKLFPSIKDYLTQEAEAITQSMSNRGGGVLNIELINQQALQEGLYQLHVHFETCDSMGANFINTVLESFARSLKQFFASDHRIEESHREIDVLMSILSNYTPDCVVKVMVECPVEEMGVIQGLPPEIFAERFEKAINISREDTFRAVTHNKGIFNGIDAVVLATANDFRAVEACGHAYAARDGQYRGLSNCMVENGIFRFWLELPMAVGTIGGLTSLHPIAKTSLELLGNPGASELMEIIAATGLAQNFAAIKSLITTGIQKGHMKMHLRNILNQIKATEEEIEGAMVYFSDKIISFKDVREYIATLRTKNPVS